MIMLDVGLISVLLGIFGMLVAVLRWVIKMNRRFERLERHDAKDYEARCILLGGVYAALDGLHQLGANGNVTRAEEELKEYMFKK